MISQIFNPNKEPAIPTGTPTNEVNAEIETHIDNRNENKKISKVIQSPGHFFNAFYLLNHHVLFLPKHNLLLHLFYFSLKSKSAVFAFKVVIYYLVILFIVIWRN